MTIRRLRIPGTLALAAFLGCSTAGTLVVGDVAPGPAIAQDVDDGYFYASLAPHGQWFFQADFGWVWHPARVSAGWRPYTEGQWIWGGDVGWTWASEEPWGWATYHYGRWYFDPMYGWSWVPGRTWAPAWVSWRVDAGYIGWAPLWPVYFDLHPEYRWDRWHHDRDWNARHHDRDWDRWVFTRDRDFTSERVGRRAITDRRERDSIYSKSRDVTQFDENHPERIGHSIDRKMVEKATGQPVRSVTIEAADKPEARDDARGDRVRMFRPRIKEASDKTPDRLGLAEPVARDARENDTIRREKSRLDGAVGTVPGDGKAAARPDRAKSEREAKPADRVRAPQKDAEAKPAKSEPRKEPQRATPEPRKQPERANPEPVHNNGSAPQQERVKPQATEPAPKQQQRAKPQATQRTPKQQQRSAKPQSDVRVPKQQPGSVKPERQEAQPGSAKKDSQPGEPDGTPPGQGKN